MINRNKLITGVIALSLIMSVPMQQPVDAAEKDASALSDFENIGNNKEEAFTADELRKFLETQGKPETDKKEKEERPVSDEEEKAERWRKFMELSVNGIVSDNEADSKNGDADDPLDINDRDNDRAEEAEKKYYVPPKGEEWKLMLVNKQNPIPSDYDAQLVYINGSARIRKEIAVPLAEMFEAAEDDNVTLTVCSAYRSHEHQQELFDRKIRGYTKKGLSYLDAFRIGSYSVIIPGTSEHELGMALDIVTPGYTQLNDGFADTEAGKWLAENAYKYGFILRYPEGKEYITGITFEPWHYRYVGEEAAKDIYESGLTLEEYLDEIEI